MMTKINNVSNPIDSLLPGGLHQINEEEAGEPRDPEREADFGKAY